MVEVVEEGQEEQKDYDYEHEHEREAYYYRPGLGLRLVRDSAGVERRIFPRPLRSRPQFQFTTNPSPHPSEKQVALGHPRPLSCVNSSELPLGHGHITPQPSYLLCGNSNGTPLNSASFPCVCVCG